MSLGRKKKITQKSLWIPHHKVARSAGRPFYRRLNAVLADEGFDAWVEHTCAPLKSAVVRRLPPACISGCF